MYTSPVLSFPARIQRDREKQELISKRANLAYPIRNGIPIMLPEEARNLDEQA